MAECSLLYDVKTPRIFVTPTALYKMRYYIDNTENEIGWLGYVNKIADDEYLIEDVFLLKQKVHSATTEIDPEALATMATELIKQGQEGIAKYNSIRVWGHSHVNMSTNASGQDDKQMEEFATSDYYIRLIGNKRSEWNVCLYDYANNILWSELILEYYYDVDVTPEELDQEIKDNVSKFEYRNNTIGFSTNRTAYKKWWDDDYDDYGYEYGYGYGGYSPNTKRQADYLREEKEAEEKEEKEEKIDEPYPIDWEIDKEDIRNMKRYYSSEEELCLFMATAEVSDVKNAILEDYNIELDKELIEEFMEDMRSIWDKKYANQYIEKEGNI